MKHSKEYYALITVLLIATLNEVQGRQFLTNQDAFPSSRLKLSGKRTANNFRENAVGNDFMTLETAFNKNTATTVTKVKRNRYHAAAKSRVNEVPKLRKISERELNQTETLKLILPVRRAFPTQKIYCRQINKSELNDRGEVIESVQHICAPLTVAAGNGQLGQQSIHKTTEKPFEITSTTPKGINCRIVMNSELNGLGKIIDTVTEVCDPPPSTTTTTRKPTTTATVATTTPKTLIKICWPVMDSYLNEEGKIIDSVNMVCKMQEQQQ